VTAKYFLSAYAEQDIDEVIPIWQMKIHKQQMTLLMRYMMLLIN